ncbi:eukaryotic translation initiation factor 3 subunit 4, putative [Theileria equi strain WA]|uniref:Eukaryotic translation initiation factor 3 subunit G n=1 Tax=Theileria equi strain WA TaxID=1537102 RepID=L0AZE8_THEEQ|nr:eukaryotic translation initiation factor 3 subunit 4, putative [Theileria equi strain WA]AFZ80279.1 eukaryotic translation initiation factor 3 subunit 4, putative [Theileria equi strain WA]|eukprot:XP_004829945.1 eukaryotic translation initiation factor 3 subunit 4, putative [Theileria equi strain WA]
MGIVESKFSRNLCSILTLGGSGSVIPAPKALFSQPLQDSSTPSELSHDVASDTKWADIDADDDYDNENLNTKFVIETSVDAHGIKTFTSYSTNSRGQSVKITKKVNEIRTKKQISKAALERKNFEPFNLNEENDSGIVMISNEDISIEIPKSERRRYNQDDDIDYIYSPPDASILRATRELKLKFKSLREDDNLIDTVDEKEAPAKYIPPSRKDGDRRNFDENTIRITNLSEDVKEKDLTDLFGTVGRIHRAYLAKHKETQNSKGFAFITYASKQDAVNAIAKFNRWGYNNLLLNVEWARPPTRDR